MMDQSPQSLRKLLQFQQTTPTDNEFDIQIWKYVASMCPIALE